jgi:phosphoenolpyruvate phosphomutase
MGLLNVRGEGRERLQAVMRELQERSDFASLDMPALLDALIEAGESIEVQYVHGHWRGVNDLDDFRRAGDFAHAQAPFASAVGDVETAVATAAAKHGVSGGAQ